MVDSVGNNSSSGFTIYTTHENGTHIEVRVDADAPITLGPDDFPTGLPFNVTGVGSQFDNNFPWKEGYQLLALDITIASGIKLLNAEAIRMVPNPANELIRLNSDLTIMKVEIYSTNGRQLYSKDAHGHEVQINLNHLPAGLHMVKASTAEGVWIHLLSVVK
jgi:hypothetical protein